MKSLITILTFLLFAVALSGQSFVENNYENLIDADESTVVKVNQSTFRYASAFVEEAEPEDEIDAKEMLDNIEYFIMMENAKMVGFDPPNYMYEPHVSKMADLNK